MAGRTLNDVFQDTVADRGERDALRWREGEAWAAMTYEAYAERVRWLALALIERGVEPGDRVAILSPNRPAWSITDIGVLHAGAVSVPLYDTLTPDQMIYTLADAGARLLFVSDPDLLGPIADRLEKETEVEQVVLYDDAAEAEGAESLDEVLAAGKAIEAEGGTGGFEERWQAVDPEDLATLIYTSGTTGLPKGVMLTHRNIVSNIDSGLEVLPLGERVEHLSFLPLSHSYERGVGHFAMIAVGATIWFAESVETIARDLKEARPTYMLAVPRLYEKMHAGIMDKVHQAPPLRQALFDWALRTGEEMMEHRTRATSPPLTLGLRYAVADRLVLSTVREAAGLDRVRFMGSGAAALNPEVARFFLSLGLTLLEGYGLTESSPVISFNRPGQIRIGSVGLPIPGVEVRIDEEGWPVEGEGELLARGPNIMEGYWNQPEETRETLDEDGWLHTGDVARQDGEGFLYITDRKKQLFKTAYGKYVAPAAVEGLLTHDRLVELAVIFGAERKYVSALLQPDFEALAAWAEDQGLTWEDTAELLDLEPVQARFQQAVDEANQELARHEQVKAFALLDRELVVGEELTPTLKVKRRVVEETFEATIQGLYPED